MLGLKPRFQGTMQNNHGLPRGQFANFARAPGHGHSHAHANGFAKSLFGRKPSCHIAHATFWPPCATCFVGDKFGVTQDFLSKAITMLLQASSDTPHVTQVGPNAVNHGLAPAIGLRPSNSREQWPHSQLPMHQQLMRDQWKPPTGPVLLVQMLASCPGSNHGRH